jgi:hypothetical protein
MLDLNPASHNDVDQSLINNLPTTGTGLSDLITLSTPGVVADSNGFFHPQGDHAQTSYVVDGQPISDQQSRGVLHADARKCVSEHGNDHRVGGRAIRR